MGLGRYVVDAAILDLRAELVLAGHDCGPATIAHHLGQRLATGLRRQPRYGASCAATS